VQWFSIPDSACPPWRNRGAAKGPSPDTSRQDIPACQAQAGSCKQGDKAQGCDTARSTAPVRCVISHNQFNLAPREGRSSDFAPT